MVNPCIIGKDGRPEGCVTPSVIDRFVSAFYEICKVACLSSDAIPPQFEEAMLSLAAALKESLDCGTPSFLNELRRVVSATKEISGEEFWRSIQDIRRELVRYCTSKAVRDEVLGITIRLLERSGFRYQGSNIQGIAKDECVFDLDGIRIGVKIRDYRDLFSFWGETGTKCATVYCSGRRYSICESNCSPERFAEAVAACISDDKSEFPAKEEDDFGNADLAKALMEIAEALIGRTETLAC